MITIFAIGKKHEQWIADGVLRYQERLRAPWNIEWVLLPHSTFEGSRARQEESERIIGRVDPSDYVILLDERGKMLDSPALAHHIDNLFTNSRNVVMVIGGAYGVDEHLTQRADLIWSLSPLVFPHQLARLILVEQLYRAQEIAAGRAYHHQ
jgi:23S rRNA (pseudouridine1915-N3)-methyltransferase